MASGLGITDHLIHGTTYRQLFFARYIDWVFTTPLLLLDLVRWWPSLPASTAFSTLTGFTCTGLARLQHLP